MPEKPGKNRRTQGLDIAAIALAAADSAFPPGGQDQMIDGEELVRVWPL